MNRREFLQLGGSVAANFQLARTIAAKPGASRPILLRIAPVSIELAPGNVIRTIGYNGQVPGPLVRVRERVPVAIDVFNDTNHPELVDWHGLQARTLFNQAMECEVVLPGERRRCIFRPTRSGARWYHGGTGVSEDPAHLPNCGRYGFLYVEPAVEAGAYDREVFLAVHHWAPFRANDRATSQGLPQVEYRYASFNDKVLGASEPIQVRQRERVLFRFLNASPAGRVCLTLPGHRFTVLALDGNAVPNPASVEVLSIAFGERIDAVVEMTSPGKWILGSLSRAERAKGLGIVIEYANRTGRAEWAEPAKREWSYARFTALPASQVLPDETIEMIVETKLQSEVNSVARTINGKLLREIEPIHMEQGRRYRLRMINATASSTTVYFRGKSFELARAKEIPISGVWKDTVWLEPYGVIDADVVTDDAESYLFDKTPFLARENGHGQPPNYIEL